MEAKDNFDEGINRLSTQNSFCHASAVQYAVSLTRSASATWPIKSQINPKKSSHFWLIPGFPADIDFPQ